MGYFRVHVTAFSSLSGSFTNTQPTEDFYKPEFGKLWLYVGVKC